MDNVERATQLYRLHKDYSHNKEYPEWVNKIDEMRKEKERNKKAGERSAHMGEIREIVLQMNPKEININKDKFGIK